LPVLRALSLPTILGGALITEAVFWADDEPFPSPPA